MARRAHSDCALAQLGLGCGVVGLEISFMADTPEKRKRSWAFRIARAVCVLLLLLVTLIYFVYVLPFWGIPFSQSRHGRVPLTPPWALECWLWEDDVNTEAYVKEVLEGYAKYDLPVRTILIDSPWSWQYNDFKLDDERYPEADKFFIEFEIVVLPAPGAVDEDGA